MLDPYLPENTTAYNEVSLKTLVRASCLSQGQFRLILARCNYTALQVRMVRRLRELSPVEIRELVLPESVKSLYTTIKAELRDEIPQALMIFGLESVSDLRAVLTSSNYVREEFNKSFPFPLILWINDEVLIKLIRLAPDLESWATSIEFTLTTDELLNFLRQKTDEIFASDSNPSLENYIEVEAAWKDLQRRGQGLEPDLEASLEFIRGLDAFAGDRIDEALEHCYKNLTFWQQSNNLERQGIVLLNIALCHTRKAEKHRAGNQHYWEQARDYLQQCLDVFEQAQRLDLVAEHISKLGEVLRRLQAWEQLQSLAEKALALHQEHRYLRQIAQDYGFLAEVALKQSDWAKANRLAQQAQEILDEGGLYRFLLARSQRHLGQVQEAIANLEQARHESKPQYNPELYIDILGELRSLYFNQHQYLESFLIKQEQRLIEQQYGFRAFIGTGYLQPHRQVINPLLVQVNQQAQATIGQEIAVSGRQQDVNRLIERISRNDCKLTVIYGPSGVGKSSILKAGLVPALQELAIGERDALPVVVRVYRNWVRELGGAIAEELQKIRRINLSNPLDSVPAISEQLRKNAELNLLTVLIFDQVEELFFISTDKFERIHFFEVLRICLNISFVKVILSLREDYLHYLLEGERLVYLDVINNNILDKKNRYYLGNFSLEDAKAVIQSLTERSHFYLEPVLVDELMRDLADELGEVRPIELQLVCVQLQTDNIRTLEQYHQIGANPKEKLVQRSLQEVIKDCGTENETAAQLVLYLLTDENSNRPPKSRTELAAELATLSEESNKLDLVLTILVASGLVFLIPEAPANRYQLVHDYLVPFIRQQQGFELIAELKKEKEQRQLSENQLTKVLRQRLRIAVAAGFALAVSAALAMGLVLQAQSQKKEAEAARNKAEHLQKRVEQLQRELEAARKFHDK